MGDGWIWISRGYGEEMNENEGKRNRVVSICCSVTKRYRFPEFFLFFLIEILHFGFRFHIEKIYIDHGPREKRHHDHLLHRGLGCVYGLYE